MPEGIWGYAFVVLVAVVAHESWRWAGLYLGRDLRIDGPVFQWVKLVATALVAALVMRLIVFPAGLLATVAFPLRAGAVAIAVAVFYLAGRNLAAGVLGGAVSLIALVMLLG